MGWRQESQNREASADGAQGESQGFPGGGGLGEAVEGPGCGFLGIGGTGEKPVLWGFSRSPVP